MGSRRVHTQKRATNVYLALRFLEAALLMLFFVVSLVLAGGQVSASRDPSWGVIVDFPVFTLPGWLMLGISVLGALAAIPVLLLARVTDAGRVVGAFGASSGAAISWFLLAIAQPDMSAADCALRWSAAYCDGAVAAVFLIVGLIVAVLSDRRRAQAGLPLHIGMDEEAGER